jgi:hypothetical protein
MAVGDGRRFFSDAAWQRLREGVREEQPDPIGIARHQRAAQRVEEGQHRHLQRFLCN